MQSGKLQGIFQESPPSEALPSAFTIFGLPTEVEGLRVIRSFLHNFMQFNL